MSKLIIHILLFFMASGTVMGQVKMKKIAKLPKNVSETSGLVFYQDKYLITHNDGGHKSELFVLSTDGELVRKINIDDTDNKDWEDLTTDDKGRLFIGDFGNNSNDRKKCKIYILPEGFIDKKKVKPEKITFWYEDQKDFPPKPSERNYDCEAFFWKDGYFYLLTKCRTKPYTGESFVYRIPDTPGKHKAKKVGVISLCKTGWRFCSVTGADYDVKTNSVVLLTYTRLYVLTGFKGNAFWEGNLRSYALPVIKQREAICFKDKKHLYMTDEVKKGIGGGNLYKLTLK